jgi:hypothetical protein
MMKLIVAGLAAAVFAMAGCGGGSSSVTTTAPATTVTDHLVNAGKEIGAAATQAAQNAKPYIDAGVEKTREGVNTAAAWVEKNTRATTATGPATTTAPTVTP